MNKIEKQHQKLIELMKREEKRKKIIEEKEQLQMIKEKMKLEKKKIAPEKNIFTVGYWKDWFKKGKKENLLIVNLELLNGMHTTFYVNIDDKENSFKYKDKRYVYDPRMKYFNIKYNKFCIDYHEGFSLPIKREFPLNDTNTAIQEAGIVETEYATNPSSLERFMNSSIIDMMLHGGGINQMLKILLIIAGLTAIFSLANLLMVMYAEGYFSNIGI